MLKYGITPKAWSLGIIKPIYKNKGSPSDPNNYRGITLLSCVGKLFTALINKRLYNWYEQNNILGEEQAGFRSGYSTTDHIFVLNCIIQHYLTKRKKLFCAFVDFKKAFDTINRTKMWQKVINSGANGNILKVVYIL